MLIFLKKKNQPICTYCEKVLKDNGNKKHVLQCAINEEKIKFYFNKIKQKENKK